jgi:hypothetical protein
MSGVLHGVLAAIAGARDAFFRYVTLLLNTNATNGAQNNTFLDSSTNNFSITRNGDTTQGSFNPYMPTGYWSGYFDGTGDWLSVPDNAAFTLGSGDFTVEAWVYNGGTGSRQGICGQIDSAGTISSLSVYVEKTAANKLLGGVASGSTSYTATSTADLPLNQWVHVAFVRNGNTGTLYINGTSDGTVSLTGVTVNDSTNTFSIGRLGEFNSLFFPGYISNFRLVKGTAVYTANFTPPTSPLTAITNTSLLCLQDNRFKDNSTNAFAITVNGDTRISKFAPFNPPESYSTASYGGSGYFDGTGDYLSIADSATIRFGTGAFTIQGWVYRGAAGATHTIAAKGGASTGWVLQITSTNVLRFTDTTTNIDTTTTIPASTWAHVAVVRTSTGSNGLKLYINAVDSATGTSSTDFSQTDALNIGADRSNANAFNGYISNLKYTVGTAESISVPASPITGGTVLLNFTNAGIFDAATINDGQTVGNAQVSTTQAKWGTTSMYFDGAGDEAVTVAKANLVLGTAPFTVEMWVYCTNAASGATQDLVGNLTNVPGDTNWHFSISSTGVLQSGTYNNLLASSGAATLSSTTWTHVALTFDGTTYRVFINGTVGSTTSTVVRNLSDATSAIKVGNTNFGSRFFNGYIDDLRITRGVARYTSNFTAPTAAFPLQ